MYDVNPLGPLTHLKELERQALASYRLPGKARPSFLALVLTITRQTRDSDCARLLRHPLRSIVAPATNAEKE
jgi:hypothetical protein